MTRLHSIELICIALKLNEFYFILLNDYSELFEVEEAAAAQSGAGRSNAGKHTALRIRADEESVTLNTVSANLQRLTVTVQDLKAELGEKRHIT